MKKFLLGLVSLLALMSSNAQVQSLKAVSYRGAFAPAPTAQWTDGWVNWDPQNTVYPTTNVTVNANITTNTRWTKNNTYLLDALVYVTNGATLTIEPGTVIRGGADPANSALIITRGAKVYAVGTADAPIVFTSNKSVNNRAPGDWGGIILLGNAKVNAAGGVKNIEGITATTNTQYGGSDDNDNSGTLKYVRCEYSGYALQPNQEINGFTFGGVGRGTTLDYLQASFINDDAYEWFGGTVNASHLVSYRGIDDEFDTDNGFSGTVQFCLGVRDPSNFDVSQSNGFESDNDGSGTTATPFTSAIFSNVTLIGPLRGSASASVNSLFRRAAHLRRNTKQKVINSLLLDYPTGVFIDGALGSAVANAQAGELLFANNVVAGTRTGRVFESGNTNFSQSAILTWWASNSNDSAATTSGILTNAYPTDYINPDFRPATGSIALSGASFSNSSISPYVIVEATSKNVLKKVDYRGAFAPAPTAMWTNGWVNWDPQNTVYPTTNVTVNSNITSNTTWTKNNTYLLDALVYVTNGATLTIEPGTVIRGGADPANSALIITRGAKINAVGTPLAPIVFTSNKTAGSRAPGDWGGIILLGNAKVNAAGGVKNIEGITATSNTQYGGSDDNDNSGTLKYVRCEYSGYALQPNQEINGFTFGGVGRGTTLDYLQASFINDDAYEWFGGTVNASHLVSYRGIDDEFDTDNGFSGTVQFCLGVRDPLNFDVSQSNGFESDNDGSGTAATPFTSALFSNVTLIGPLRGNASASVNSLFRRAAHLRRNTKQKVINSLLLDYPTGVFIDGALGSAVANAQAGELLFANNVVAGTRAGRVFESGNTNFNQTDILAWWASNNNDSAVTTSGILTNAYPADYINPDFRPAAGSIALSNYTFTKPVVNNVLTTSIENLTVITGSSASIADDITYNDVILSGGTLTINAGKTLTINGTLYLNSGTLINNGGSIVYGGGALTLNDGKSVNFSGSFSNDVINNGTITLAANTTFGGSFTNNGVIKGAGSYLASPKLSLTGVGVNVAGNGSVGVLEINSNGTINNTGSDSLKVVNKLILTKGVFASNGKLTIKSTSLDSTAIVDVVTAGSVSGNVVAERAIPAGFRAYRDLAPGINTNGGTIFSNWQEGGNQTTGYGVYILGAKGTPGTFQAASGIDNNTRGTASAFTYRNSTWNTYSSTANFTKSGALSPLDYHYGYRVLVNGDRNFNVDGVSQYFMKNKTVLRATGTLVTGNVDYNSTYLNTALNSFSMIGNPYLCPIDWDAVYADGSLDNANLTSTYYFITRNDSTTSVGSIGYVSFYATYDALFGSSSGQNTRFIMPGQAVFVQNNGTTATGTLTIKESHKAPNNTRKQYGIFSQVAKNNMYVALMKKTAFGFEKADQIKLVVTNAIAANRGVNKLDNATDNLSIVEGNKSFAIAGYKAITAKDTINLSVDKLTAGTAYQLVVNAADFSVEGATPYLLDKATNTVTEIKGEQTVVNFTADNAARFAIVFANKAATVAASTATIALYPNPVVGKSLNVTTSNLAAGKYTVVVYNTLGSKVYSTSIDGAVNNHNLKVSFAAGNYKLVVMDAAGKIVNNSSLQVK